MYKHCQTGTKISVQKHTNYTTKQIKQSNFWSYIAQLAYKDFSNYTKTCSCLAISTVMYIGATSTRLRFNGQKFDPSLLFE